MGGVQQQQQQQFTLFVLSWKLNDQKQVKIKSTWLSPTKQNQCMGLMLRHLVNSCVRYLQKINFLTEKSYFFLDIVGMGNENVI